MPRYFFHIEDGKPHRDETGIELAGLAEAKCEAMRYAGHLICDSLEDFWDAGEWCLTATDDKGLTLFSLTLLGIEAPAVQCLRAAPQASAA
jgi:hypothetical protein